MTVLLDTISAKLVSHVAHSRPIFVNCSISSTSCKSILWSILCLFLFFAWGHRYCIIACSLLKFETTFCFVFLSCSATSCDIVRFSEFLVKIFTIKSLALSIYLSRKGDFFPSYFMPRITASLGYIIVSSWFHFPGDLSVEFIKSWHDGQNSTKHERNSFFNFNFAYIFSNSLNS